MKEKTNKSIIISVVVALHVLLVICFIIQGCGTLSPMKRSESPARKPEVGKVPMPEPEPVEEIKIPTTPPVIEKEALPVITTKYVVRRGDTLAKIAKRYNLKIAEIVALNKIKDPNKIREKDVLLLPGTIKIEPPPVSKQPSTSAGETTKSASAKVSLPVGGGKEYMVKPGDSLSKIAKEHGTTVKVLKEANSLTSDKIIVGQKLIIPDLAVDKTVDKSEMTTKSDITQSVEQPVHPADAGVSDTPRPSVASSDVALSSSDVGQSVTPPSQGTSSGVGYVTIHTVAPGETLESIARAWLVDKNAIKKVNNLTSDVVSPGQVLKIPLTK